MARDQEEADQGRRGQSPQGPGAVTGAPGGRREQRPAHKTSSELKGGKGLAAAPGRAGAQSRVLGVGGKGSSRQPRLSKLISLPSLQGKAAVSHTPAQICSVGLGTGGGGGRAEGAPMSVNYHH